MTKRVYFVAHGGTVQGTYESTSPTSSHLGLTMYFPGVGFRYFTRKRARAYGLTGWCRNTPDNTVEGEAQGEEASVEKLIKDVDEGPSGATVVKLTQEARDVIADEAEFTVRH